MSLGDQVGLIPHARNGHYDPTNAGRGGECAPLTCHTATSIWLFVEQFRRLPTMPDIYKIGATPNKLTGRMMSGSSTEFIKRLLDYGEPVGRSDTPAVLVPGCVVVFVRGGQPAHSCVATTPTRIGGYNQLDWFTGPGKGNDFSWHTTAELVWLPDADAVTAVAGGHPHELVTVPEKAALGLMAAEFA